MENLVFRKIKKEDYIDIKNNIYTDMDLEEVKNICIDFENQMEQGSNWYYFCVELDGKVEGIVILEQDERESMQHLGNIYTIVVSAEKRQQHLAQYMLENVDKIAKDLGIKILKCECIKDTPADNLFKNNDFKVYGELNNALIEDGICYDLVLYVKTIDEILPNAKEKSDELIDDDYLDTDENEEIISSDENNNESENNTEDLIDKISNA